MTTSMEQNSEDKVANLNMLNEPISVSEFNHTMGKFIDPMNTSMNEQGEIIYISKLNEQTAYEVSLTIRRAANTFHPDAVQFDVRNNASAIKLTIPQEKHGHKMALKAYYIVIAPIAEEPNYILNITTSNSNCFIN